jgi:ferredoxin
MTKATSTSQPFVLSLRAAKRGVPRCLFREKGFTFMAHVINQNECIQCGACESECLEGAISMAGETYVVDPAKCQDCGSCIDVCPTGGIAKA